MNYALHEMVNDFLAALAHGEAGQRIGSTNTLLAYSSDLHQFCSYLIALQVPGWLSVTSEHVQGYLHDFCQERAYTERTIARKLCALKSFFRYMQRRGLIVHNPTISFSHVSVEGKAPQMVSPAQVTDLFQQMEAQTLIGLRDLAICHLLYTSGMYASELISLDVQDFEQQHVCICCPGRKDASEGERTYPLSAATVKILTSYLEQARPAFVRSTQEEALFLNHHGARLTRQGTWLIIKGYARSCGIAELSPRMLRHSFDSSSPL